MFLECEEWKKFEKKTFVFNFRSLLVLMVSVILSWSRVRKTSGASFRRGDFAPREPEFDPEFGDANF